MADKNRNLPAKREQAGFLDKVRQSKAISATPKRENLAKALTSEARPRLLFSMDATASREPSWNMALWITGSMFQAVPGALDVALAWHSSGRLQQLTAFSSDAKVFLSVVESVRCRAGMTALNQVLDKATEIPRLKALIYIGDCFEENSSEAVELAQQLKLKGVRCFMFHDASSGALGYDIVSARTVFSQITQITSGALLPFDETSPELVKALLSAISIYAAQGINALKALAQKNKTLPAAPAARLLLEQMLPQAKG